MRKIISLLLTVVLCVGLCPVEASDFSMISMNFNDKAKHETQSFTALYGSEVSYGTSYDGNSAKLSNPTGNTAKAVLEFSEASGGMLKLEQAVYTNKFNAAYVKLLSGNTAVAAISFSQGEIKALGESGWFRLRSYTQGTWYGAEISYNLSAKTYEVKIDGIKLGGVISARQTGTAANAVEYSVCGGDLQIDDILIYDGQSASAVAVSEGNSEVRRAYYEKYKARYDWYEVPTENIIPGELVTGAVTASSTADGFDVKNVVDGDNGTKWQAAPALQPIDNGKSLMLNHPSATEGTQLASYSFTPVKGVVVIEEDILGGDVSSEKAIPYVFSSSGNYVSSMLLNAGTIMVAASTKKLQDISSKTWYHLKIEIDTAKQTYNVYIDNVLRFADVAFRAKCDDVAKIQFHMSGGNTGVLCVDNLKVYTKSPLGEFQEMILDEDFESYAIGSVPSGWNANHSDSGEVSVQEYGVQSEYEFSQSVVMTNGREGEFEGAYVVFPEGIYAKYTLDISRKNNSFVTVLDKTDQFYGGEQTNYYSPVRAKDLRITITDAIDSSGNPVHAQIAEMKIILKHKAPIENVAFTANITVSGSAGATYDGRGINDNIVAEFGAIGEWRSGNEEEKWAELTWETPQTIDRIVIYDSAKLEDHTKSGIFTFDDGSRIEVTDIANTGMPKTIDFDAKTVSKLRFTVTDYEGAANLSEIQVLQVGEKPEMPIYLEPDEVIRLVPEYWGRWCAINDLDNDGELEYICARVVDLTGDNHYCGSICAQKKDGTILWTWGDPTKASAKVGSDVPCQVYDIDNDGYLEVLACDRTTLYIFNGLTGEVKKKYPLPNSEEYPKDLACDTIIIADISGKGYATDIIVKNRYRDVWAYTSSWEPIWHVCMPGDKKVGHYPQPIDIDNDGHDELIVGYACVDEDGSLVFDMKKEQYPGRLEDGHKDSLEIVNFVLVGDVNCDMFINQKDLDLLQQSLAGKTALTGNHLLSADCDGNGVVDENDKKLLEQKLAGELKSFPNKGIPKEEQRFCMTPCGGGSNIIMFDGNGDRVWSLDDATHYETVEKGNFRISDDPFQIVITNTTPTQGNQPFEIVDLKGNVIRSRYGYMRNRELNVINWTGEGGLDYILLPTDNIVIDGDFNVKLKPLMPFRGYDTMGMKSYQSGAKNYTCDMDGDGTTDIVIQADETDSTYIYVYYNKNGAKVADGTGRGYNISQY